jgi:thymidylate synthase
MFLKGIIEELLFFIKGETDTKKLEELGVNIWKGNTSREFLDKRGL